VDEDVEWFKIDVIEYEEFLGISIMMMPPGNLTTSVVFPDDVHPGKEKANE
jgi:hypothetical protein